MGTFVNTGEIILNSERVNKPNLASKQIPSTTKHRQATMCITEDFQMTGCGHTITKIVQQCLKKKNPKATRLMRSMSLPFTNKKPDSELCTTTKRSNRPVLEFDLCEECYKIWAKAGIKHSDALDRVQQWRTSHRYTEAIIFKTDESGKQVTIEPADGKMPATRQRSQPKGVQRRATTALQTLTSAMGPPRQKLPQRSQTTAAYVARPRFPDLDIHESGDLGLRPDNPSAARLRPEFPERSSSLRGGSGVGGGERWKEGNALAARLRPEFPERSSSLKGGPGVGRGG